MQNINIHCGENGDKNRSFVSVSKLLWKMFGFSTRGNRYQRNLPKKGDNESQIFQGSVAPT